MSRDCERGKASRLGLEAYGEGEDFNPSVHSTPESRMTLEKCCGDGNG